MVGSVATSSNATTVKGPVYIGSVFYKALTSSVFAVVAVAIIIILFLLLLGLIYLYITRVKNKKYEYSKETIRYSPMRQTDQLDDDENKEKRRKRTNKGSMSKRIPSGLGYDASPRYSATTSKLSPVMVSPHMDISAGHLLLNYIESNLKNQNQLQNEWEMLHNYQPEGASTSIAELSVNMPKNRINSLPYDHSRVKLKEKDSVDNSDYINASFIIDSDPSNPKYIATQTPLKHTIADFWQMVWENSIGVIVMLTPTIDLDTYWPKSGIATHSKYEVRLVSEHPHSQDYIVRSIILQNNQTSESRTITHFQYLTWNAMGAPKIATPLLDFRRKVIKAYAGQNTPLLVHCSDGVGRTGTYILIDMVLGRVQGGAKEINLAATVEHLRDHRPGMVQTKPQFEFALSALVEETRAMLEVASQRQKAM